MSKQLDRIEKYIETKAVVGLDHLTMVRRDTSVLFQWHEEHAKQLTDLQGSITQLCDMVARLAATQVDAGRLVDRLIEMSLVNRGQAQEATIHRAQSRLDSDFSNPQSWAEEEEKADVWPPPNCDAANI